MTTSITEVHLPEPVAQDPDVLLDEFLGLFLEEFEKFRESKEYSDIVQKTKINKVITNVFVFLLSGGNMDYVRVRAIANALGKSAGIRVFERALRKFLGGATHTGIPTPNGNKNADCVVNDLHGKFPESTILHAIIEAKMNAQIDTGKQDSTRANLEAFKQHLTTEAVINYRTFFVYGICPDNNHQTLGWDGTNGNPQTLSVDEFIGELCGGNQPTSTFADQMWEKLVDKK